MYTKIHTGDEVDGVLQKICNDVFACVLIMGGSGVCGGPNIDI